MIKEYKVKDLNVQIDTELEVKQNDICLLDRGEVQQSIVELVELTPLKMFARVKEINGNYDFLVKTLRLSKTIIVDE